MGFAKLNTHSDQPAEAVAATRDSSLYSSDDPGRALVDIAVVFVVSAAAFAGELAVSDHLPWGEEARGVIAVLAGAFAAVAATLIRGGSLADLGFKRPRRWLTVPFWVLGIFVVFVVAQGVAPVLIANFIDVSQPDMSRYDYIRGDLSAAIVMGLALPLTAAIPEEIVYRGFLINRLITVFGQSRVGGALAVLVQAVIFGAVHFQWGAGGLLVAAVMGLVWGFAFLLSGRNLWIVIFAHSAAHVAMIMQLYSTPVLS